MSEELMITKEDLVNWLNRQPSNDDLDLIGFITTRLENFYKLEQENKQLKEDKKKAREFIEEWCTINPTTGKCVCYLDKNRCTELYKILGDEE